MTQEEQEIKIDKSPFTIKINDTFCEWEYGFSFKDTVSISDIISAIEKEFKIESDYRKLKSDNCDNSDVVVKKHDILKCAFQRCNTDCMCEIECLHKKRG